MLTASLGCGGPQDWHIKGGRERNCPGSFLFVAKGPGSISRPAGPLAGPAVPAVLSQKEEHTTAPHRRQWGRGRAPCTPLAAGQPHVGLGHPLPTSTEAETQISILSKWPHSGAADTLQCSFGTACLWGTCAVPGKGALVAWMLSSRPSHPPGPTPVSSQEKVARRRNAR